MDKQFNPPNSLLVIIKMKKEIEIIKRINGDIWLIDEFGTKVKGRERIYCKCGFYIDLWGAIKYGRTCPIHHAVKCKRCGRESPVMEAELYY